MDHANHANLIGLRISYQDMANPYREARVLRVDEVQTPSGIDLSATAWIAWENEDGTTTLDTMNAGSLQRLLEKNASRPGSMGWRVVEG